MLEGIYGIELKSLGDVLRELWYYLKLVTGSLGERENMGKEREWVQVCERIGMLVSRNHVVHFFQANLALHQCSHSLLLNPIYVFSLVNCAP